jgi:hypothetical protein
MKSWVFEGSRTGADDGWFTLDTQNENNDLNNKSGTKTFSIRDAIECRFVRIRSTGTDHGGQNYLIVGNVELFGRLRQSLA